MRDGFKALTTVNISRELYLFSSLNWPRKFLIDSWLEVFLAAFSFCFLPPIPPRDNPEARHFPRVFSPEIQHQISGTLEQFSGLKKNLHPEIQHPECSASIFYGHSPFARTHIFISFGWIKSALEGKE